MKRKDTDSANLPGRSQSVTGTETELACCADLYDSASVGYCRLDKNGVIREINLTGAAFLGAGHPQLINSHFASFVATSCRPVFNDCLQAIGAGATQKTCECWLTNNEKSARYTHLHVTGPKNGQTFRIVLVDITERKQIEDAHLFLLQCGCREGENFFEALAAYLAKTLAVDFVCIDRLLGDGLYAETVAICCDGKFEDNVTYALKDTPCGDVVGQRICLFPTGVRHLFPHDQVLQDMKAESYAGTTLWGWQGKPIGLIALIARQPMANLRLAETLLKLVAVRAAGELERMQDRQALMQSEERFRLAMDAVSDGLWDRDVTTGSMYCTPSYFRLLGYEPDELLMNEETWLSLLHPEDRSHVVQANNACIENKVPGFEIEFRMRSKDGSWRWVLGRGKAADRNAEGKAIRLIGTHVDINGRKKDEEQNRMNEARLEALYNLSLMTQSDEQTICSYALEEGVRLTGSSIGYLHFVQDDQVRIDLYTWSRSVLKECRAEKVMHYPLEKAGVWADCVRQRRPVVHNEYQSLPNRKGYPEGHSPIIRHLSVPVFDDNRIVAIAGVGNKQDPYDDADVRQLSLFINDMWKQLARRRAEENILRLNVELEKKVAERTVQLQQALDTLRDSEERYRTVADFTCDWEYWVSPERKYLYISPSFEKITGYPVQALYDDFRFLESIVHPDDRCLIIPHMESSEHMHDVPIDFRILTPSGQERWISHVCQKVFNGDGKFLGRRGSNRDVTETKKLRDEALRDAHLASVGRLAAGMAHEINNPISGVINYAQIIRNKCSLEDKYREFLDDLIAEAERVGTIVKDMLMFARPYAGAPVRSDLRDIYGQTFSLVAKELDKNLVTVMASFPSDLPAVLVRPQQIMQVFLNIFTNAVYALNKKFFTPDPGKALDITAEQVDREGKVFVRITFHDHGIGIPADMLSRVCDPFFSTKAPGEGTGLGLSICHTIIKDHGGRLILDSLPGAYTRAIVELPAAEGAA